MRFPSMLLSAAAKPGAVASAENAETVQIFANRMDRLTASGEAGGTTWRLPETPQGPRLLVTSTGHGIVYGEHGRRILYLDPYGNLLHECAWLADHRPPHLDWARLQLDWRQWIGLKPEGLVTTASFDISRKAGWQKLTREDLYRMAAQAMGVRPDDVAFFYDDRNLALDLQGRVTIRHRKDAFYILEDGTFTRPRFMACMGAMHWEQIDFLPVVELFQSLLAGTGSATFELIRGLYDDQSEGAPRPLRYRGIPTYPSPQAFQLFSTYFQPESPGGADPLSLFMDPARSDQVAWQPRPGTPRRFLDSARGLCVTVSGGMVQKVTVREDSAALPYSRPRKGGWAPGGRLAGTTKTLLQLQDGEHREEFPLQAEWGVTTHAPLPAAGSPTLTWRSLFPDGPPPLDPVRAYFAVPLFPEDETPVEDGMTQPLALEQIFAYLEHLTPMPGAVLIDNLDLLPVELINPAEKRPVTVLFTRPEFAQRQAQRLWDQAAAENRLSGLRPVAFLDAARHRDRAYAETYGMIYRWIPFDQYAQRAACRHDLTAIAKSLVSGGSAVLAGPPWLNEACTEVALRVVAADAIAGTAGVRMHRAILPKARVNPEATLFLVQKM